MKTSTAISNRFCPQTLFLYGTYRDDGTPNFGLFCWFSYVWDDGLGIMACIGGEKLTKDLIRKNKVFSANLVSEPLLPLADHYGHTPGYQSEKMKLVPDIVPGKVLNVPVVVESPWTYELEVVREIPWGESDVFLCKIRNVMTDGYYDDETVPFDERLRKASPVLTTRGTYYSLSGKNLGAWGTPQQSLRRPSTE